MKRLLFLTAICFAWAAPAQAQLGPGVSGFSSAPTEASEAEYWVMIRRLGACLADYKTEKSQAFLMTAPNSKAESDAFDALFDKRRHRCMGNFVFASMRRPHVRGSIAEGLFEQMEEERRDAVLTQTLTSPTNISNLYQLGACYVAGNAATAVEFLDKTKVGSKGELAALRQMAADFGPCLPEDKALKLDPIDLRMAVAEALYHAANGTVSPALETELTASENAS